MPTDPTRASDPDLQNRADDLMRVHAWVEEMCDLHDV